MREIDRELFDAVEQGNFSRVKRCLDQGANINAKDSHGKTPLECAREEGHRKIVGHLAFSIAEIFSEQGKYNKAQQAYQEALDIQKVGLGSGHPDTLITQNGMALVLFKQGNYSKALETYQAAFDIQKIVLGSDHPTTLRICHNIAVVLSKQGNYSKALETYQAVYDIQKRRGVLGPDYPDTLRTRYNIAVVLEKQGKYSKALETYQAVYDIQKIVLGPDHPETLLTSRNIEVALKKQKRECLTQLCQERQKAYLHLSQFASNNLQNTSIESVKQGLYLPSFEARNVKIDGKCVAITRGLSQALLSQSGKSFLSNLATSAKIYERIAQGKQISKREEREAFAFSRLLNNFEGQLDSYTNSLPLHLMHTKGCKTLDGLSRYIAGIKGDFSIHLVTNNHVVAIYRVGDSYAYFDSNTAFVSGLKNIDQLMKVVEKGIKSAGYKVEKEGLLVEHFDVEQANKLLSNEDKQILAKEIKTERQLLAEQDKELGLIKINGQEISRVQLYDFGTKINVGSGVPLLINANMKLSSKKFQDHLDRKEVSMTARDYLGSLKNGRNMEEVVQATKVIPFIGSRREIEEAEKTRRPKQSLSELAKGAINHVLATVALTSVSRSEAKTGRPEYHLSGVILDEHLNRSYGH